MIPVGGDVSLPRLFLCAWPPGRGGAGGELHSRRLAPRQANRQIFEAVCQRLKIPEEKIINFTRQYGSASSSSSSPLSISKSGHLFKPHGIVGVCAFGGGFTFGAAILGIV